MAVPGSERAFREVASEYGDIEADHYYIDALVMEMIRDPSRFDVVVTCNLFGDIVGEGPVPDGSKIEIEMAIWEAAAGRAAGRCAHVVPLADDVVAVAVLAKCHIQECQGAGRSSINS